MSKNDGQVHFISAARLADLYRVSLRDCIVYPAGKTMEDTIRRANWIDPPGAVHLYPQYHGNYSLPGGA